jgi:hypothetical protein
MAQVHNEDEGRARTVAAGAPTGERPPGDQVTVASTPAPPAAEADRPTVPGFEILSELGRGGMGVVYKARQVSLNRFVALKMILAGPHAGADHLARFRVEAVAVARLQHAGIVQIHEIGSHGGHLYLALEYVAGGTLGRQCAGRRLPPAEAARIVAALARAVHYAHQRGIVHRDLKPGNVLLGEDGQPKITDFGLAKLLDAGDGPGASGPQTQSGSILGTPAYMAPEQAAGKRGSIGPAADVYALGAILYELLTGRPPFEGDTALDVILAVMSKEPVPPRRLAPDCPADLEAVCLKCLHKDPAGRYASAAALGDDLDRFLAGAPTEARPPSRGERVRRWVWRKRWWLAGGTAAAFLLLVLLVSLAFNALALMFAGVRVPREPEGPADVEVAFGEGIELPVPAPVGLPADLDLVPRDALMFATVRVAELWKRKDVQEVNRLLAAVKLGAEHLPLSEMMPLRLDMIERFTLVNLQSGALHESFPGVGIVATTQPYIRSGPGGPGHNSLREALEKRGHTARRYQERTYLADRSGGECVCFVNDRVLVYSPREEWLREWIERVPDADARGPLRPVLDLAASGRHHVVAGSAPPRQVREQVVKQLQGPIRGVRPEHGLKQPDPRPLLEAQSATLTAKLSSRADGATTNGLEIDLRLGFIYGNASQKGSRALVEMKDYLAGALKLCASGAMQGPPPMIAQEVMLALHAARVEQRGAEVHLPFRMEWAPNWPAEAVTAGLVAARLAFKDTHFGARVTSQNNLKGIALAMVDYHGRHTWLPPAAISDKTGMPLLSWRVALLPSLGHDKLYREFHLDEAWDSDHNKGLWKRMPDVYAPQMKPASWKPGMTYYKVFAGEQTLFPPGKKRKLSDIKGKLSSAILVVEAAEPTIWTRPGDLPYDPEQPLPLLGGILPGDFPGDFQAVFADSSTARFLPNKTSAETLRAMITGQR